MTEVSKESNCHSGFRWWAHLVGALQIEDLRETRASMSIGC